MCRTNMPAGSFNDLRNRLAAHWRVKLILLVGLTILFTVPYVYLAHHPFFLPRNLPLTWLDRAAGFHPRWVWIYQSLYLLTASLPWLANSREQLRRYLTGFALLAGASFAVFIFLPIRSPRPLVENPSGMYQLLLMYDGPYNAMPSLHVGFLCYTVCFARRIESPLPRILWAGLLGWSLLIGWSTLATTEHYALDLVVGVAFGLISDWAAWRSTLRISGVTSHSG